ncbi:hypothetical protein [Thermostaphylospora chromogena]|uniref:Transcriptional regulator TetR C-terminal Proteobacteria type domain-containing protein n=1 Tax=Thermostaphylospora chromogena TaxID=35622 RepID=A0A1H1HIW6_9ACTN|nr:hypothetical protein [Thermostaphylospora chromogena]SDR25319.1 hypothetical protein SAMN04489764_4486 [Thermostaphylospora chromogena]
MAVSIQRDADAPAERAAPSYPRPLHTRQAVDSFLALLQDRLPVWLRILHNLAHLVGKGEVNDNLLPIARAGIEYYAEIQSAALPAFSSPSVTVRYRQALRETGLGAMPELPPLAGYIAAEQRLGRVAAEVDPVASARLLLAGCFQHAYYEMLVGGEEFPSRDERAEEIVRELRLPPA